MGLHLDGEEIPVPASQLSQRLHGEVRPRLPWSKLDHQRDIDRIGHRTYVRDDGIQRWLEEMGGKQVDHVGTERHRGHRLTDRRPGGMGGHRDHSTHIGARRRIEQAPQQHIAFLVVQLVEL